jgi:hypothetical protein
MFERSVVIEAIPGPFAAHAGLLDAAEWGNRRGEHAGVDSDHAAFEPLGDPPDTADVASIEIRRQPELGGVFRCNSCAGWW